jgi:hypothetical protein
MVQLTQEGLRRLLDDVAKGQGFLPPGAYRDESGQVWRDVLEPTGRSRKNKETGQLEAVNRKVRRPVYLTNDTSREGLIAARQIAARRGMDFYWPGPPQGTAVGCLESGIVGAVGWLKYGTKREADAPVNLGAGAELFEMAYTPIEEPDDIGTSTATMQGVPIRADAPAPEAAEERSDSGLSGFTDEALDDIPVSSRPRKGH